VGWVKLDQFLPGNGKFRRASVRAQCLYMKALCYCSQMRNDGHIGKTDLIRLSNLAGQDAEEIAPELEGVGLWEADEHGDGFWVHDYSVYQPTTSAAARRAEVERQKRNRKARLAAAPEEKRVTGPMIFPSMAMGGTVDVATLGSLGQARMVG
jgi:hypothetical protein